MVRTASTMLPLGTQLPAFELGVVSGVNLAPNDCLKGLSHISNFELTKRPLFLIVICAHCPFVKHVESGITNLFNSFGDDVQFLAISSNSLKTHPQDAPEFLASQANQLGWKFPYLFDSDHYIVSLQMLISDILHSGSFGDIYRYQYSKYLDSQVWKMITSEVKNRDDHICSMCGKSDMHKDFIIPRKLR